MEKEDKVAFYRGGRNFEAKPNEVRIDLETNTVKPTHRISVYQDAAERVRRFGGAYKIVFLPDTLKLMQRGEVAISVIMRSFRERLICSLTNSTKKS